MATLTARNAESRPLAGAAVRALAMVGASVLAMLLWAGVESGRFPIPGGDVVNFLAAGERLRAGGEVYVGAWNQSGTVYYAPPLVVAFAGFSLLPGWVLYAVLVAVDVAGLRYLAGSWTRAGILGLCPLTAFQLASGNPNFAIVAAVLAAHRHHAGPLALAALAKLGPAVALPLGRWRQAAAWLAVAVLVTLPWAGLWPEWIRFLIEAPKDAGWPTIVPLAWRLPVIVVLLALRRPWAQMLAGCLAIPGFYIVTLWATAVLVGRLALDRGPAWADR